jgi:phosphatidylglycerol:prolipoprotein diacylglycerol transferase
VIAFYFPGGIPVYAFSIFLGLGALSGLGWVALHASEKNALRQVNAGLWVLFAGLLGGRAAYVAVHWPYFQAHLGESLQVHLGGLSWPGALAGGLIALALYAALTATPLGNLVDALLPLVSSLSVSVWLGCWLDGCAYGGPAGAWWAVPARDEWGQLALRWPVQLLGALLSLGLFWLLDWKRDKFSRPGLAGSLGLFGLSLLLFVFSFLRADPTLYWRGLRLDAWAALAFIAITALALLVFSVRGVRSRWEVRIRKKGFIQ